MYQMFGQVLNRVEKIADFGLKQEKGFRMRPAHSRPILLGVSLGDKLIFIIIFFPNTKTSAAHLYFSNKDINFRLSYQPNE